MTNSRITRAALFAVLAGFAACRPPAPSQVRTLRLAQEAEMLALDPTLPETTTQSILSNVFETLVEFDREMHLVPALAARWTTPDEKTWLFELREGVVFHDGSPMTAADVAASFAALRGDPASGVKGLLSSVVDVSATGPGAVRIVTRRPHPLLLHDLAHVPVVKGASLAEVASHPIGTGPYRFVAWRKGQAVDLEAFPRSWRGAPSISRAAFVTLEKGPPSVQALTRGEVDLAPVPPRALLPPERTPFDIRASSGLSTYYLWMNSLPREGGRNPLADPRLRRAISLSIDRSAVAVLATGNAAARAEQLVPKTVFGFARELASPPYDPEEAARLRRASSSPSDPPLDLYHRKGEEYAAVADLVATRMRAAGFVVRTTALPWSELVDGFVKRKFPLAIVQWVFDSGDAGSFLRDTIHSRRDADGAGELNPGFSSPDFDRLIDGMESVFDGATRLARFESLMRLAAEEVPVVPLYHQPYVYGVARDVDWEPRIDGHLRVFEMSFSSAKTPSPR